MVVRPRFERRRVRQAAVLGLVLAVAAAAAEARPRALGADEIVALIEGNTIYGFDPRSGGEFAMFHSAGGRVGAEVRNVNDRTDRSNGRWWVTEDDKLCIDWEHPRWIDVCAGVVRDGESITFVDGSGQIISFGEVAPGNPSDL